MSLLVAKRRATYDQFGEEGLKGGVPDGMGGFTSGYTFHGDSFKVFSQFFGGKNPFAGEWYAMNVTLHHIVLDSVLQNFLVMEKMRLPPLVESVDVHNQEKILQ